MRSLRASASDPPAKLITLGDIYDAENPRHTCAELDRYIRATQSEMRPAQCLALAGPDGTKVGSDGEITVAMIMSGDTGKVAVGTPQDRFCHFHIFRF